MLVLYCPVYTPSYNNCSIFSSCLFFETNIRVISLKDNSSSLLNHKLLFYLFAFICYRLHNSLVKNGLPAEKFSMFCRRL